MARRRYKPQKDKQRQEKPVEPEPAKLEKQPPRGETLRYGGLKHAWATAPTMKYYETTIGGKSGE